MNKRVRVNLPSFFNTSAICQLVASYLDPQSAQLAMHNTAHAVQQRFDWSIWAKTWKERKNRDGYRHATMAIHCLTQHGQSVMFDAVLWTHWMSINDPYYMTDLVDFIYNQQVSDVVIFQLLDGNNEYALNEQMILSGSVKRALRISKRRHVQFLINSITCKSTPSLVELFSCLIHDGDIAWLDLLWLEIRNKQYPHEKALSIDDRLMKLHRIGWRSLRNITNPQIFVDIHAWLSKHLQRRIHNGLKLCTAFCPCNSLNMSIMLKTNQALL